MDGRVLRLDGRVGVLGTGGQAEGRPVKTVADPFPEFQFRGLRWWWNLRVYPVPGSAAGSPWEDPCSEQWRQSVQGTGGGSEEALRTPQQDRGRAVYTVFTLARKRRRRGKRGWRGRRA